MGKMVFVAVAIGLLFGSFALTSEAGNRVSRWSHFCKDNDNLWFDNHGQCVRALATRFNNSGPAKFCKSPTPLGPELWELLGFDNRGDCVSTLHSGSPLPPPE